MKSLDFFKTTTGSVAGVVTTEQLKSIVWIIKKNQDSNLFEVWQSEDNGASGKLKPRMDCRSAENCYHETIEDAKDWIYNQEFPIYEWCPYCNEESRISKDMVLQICEHCGRQIKPCTLCEECINCPL